MKKLFEKFDGDRNKVVYYQLLTSLKIPEEQSMIASENICKLVDSKNLTDSAKQLLHRNILSAFVGNFKALSDYNISLDDYIIKDIAYKNGLAQSGSELTKQQKVLSIYEYIISKL